MTPTPEDMATARAIRKQVYIDGCSVPYTKDDDPLWVWVEADPPCPVCLAVERGAATALATLAAQRELIAGAVADCCTRGCDQRTDGTLCAPCTLARDLRGQG